MACTNCTRQTLTAFMRGVIGISLPASRPAATIRLFCNQAKSQVRHSGPKHREVQTASSEATSYDELYLPFETNNPATPERTPHSTLPAHDDAIPSRPDDDGGVPGSDFANNEPAIQMTRDSRERREGAATKDRWRRRTSTEADDTNSRLAAAKPIVLPARGPRKTVVINRQRLNADMSRNDQEREIWQIQKAALNQKFGADGWQPRKKLSPDAIDGIKALHQQHPTQFTTAVLAQRFEVSPEAIRRILKSKWKPTTEEEDSRRQRWDRRGERIWTSLVDKGVHPPKKWREMGVGNRSARQVTKPREPTIVKASTARSIADRLS